MLNIKPLSLSIPKILKKGQNNRKSLDKSKLIKEKMPKCPNNDRNSTSESGGNSQNSPSESLTVSGFQNIEQSQITISMNQINR